MVRKTFALCVLLSLTTGAYGVFTWTQPADGNGTCGSVDENTAHGPLDTSTKINVASNAGNQIDYAVVTQPAGGIELSIHGQGSFHIDQGTIDYEAAQTLVVVFTVVDKAQTPETATATCTIVVNDLNDNAPEFPANQQVVVGELTAGALVTSTFVATDADGTSPNNQITSYALEGPANAVPLFALDTMTGVITLDNVTVSCAASYELVIAAIDGGMPLLTGTGTLTVNMNAEECSAGSRFAPYTLVSMLLALAAICFICC